MGADDEASLRIISTHYILGKFALNVISPIKLLALTNNYAIFASRLTINKRMTITPSIHNSMILRMIQKIIPSSSICVNKNGYNKQFFECDALKQAVLRKVFE